MTLVNYIRLLVLLLAIATVFCMPLSEKRFEGCDSCQPTRAIRGQSRNFPTEHVPINHAQVCSIFIKTVFINDYYPLSCLTFHADSKIQQILRFPTTRSTMKMGWFGVTVKLKMKMEEVK